MSELEAYIAPTPEGRGLAEYYLKSEVDEVLTEKDKEISKLGAYIDELQNKVTDLLIRNRHMTLNFNSAFNALTHSNYKRCLAMAQRCMDANCETERDADFLVRWERRWLELANKFKENRWKNSSKL